MFNINKCYLLTPLIKNEPKPRKYPAMRFYGTKEEAELTLESFISNVVDEEPDLVFDFSGKVELAIVDENYYKLPEYDNIYKIDREIQEYLEELAKVEEKK